MPRKTTRSTLLTFSSLLTFCGLLTVRIVYKIRGQLGVTKSCFGGIVRVDQVSRGGQGATGVANHRAGWAGLGVKTFEPAKKTYDDYLFRPLFLGRKIEIYNDTQRCGSKL
jgi:hypothetical protein